MNVDNLYTYAVSLLSQLIELPSFSKEEDATAQLIYSSLLDQGVSAVRYGNNVVAYNQHFDINKPTILLNSHHDTVKPALGYTNDPFEAKVLEGKLYGLGSNDAGASLVSLIATFLYFHSHDNLPFNIALAATAEEEISGMGGIASILDKLRNITCAIVGEPTLMNMAVAERGLMVCDAIALGISGHAARQEGDNAIYKAMTDIEWLSGHKFERVSDFLGPVTMQVTSIQTENKAHNVVPDRCAFTIDIRLNECYTHEETLTTLQARMSSTVTARSMRLRSSAISMDHGLVKSGLTLGMKPYGSPTLSDKALMPFPALKLGPGDSARSHSSDEFIFLDEIKKGIVGYIMLIEEFKQLTDNDHKPN